MALGWITFRSRRLLSGGRTAEPTRATIYVFGWLLHYKRFWRYECRQCGLQLQHVITPSYDRFGPDADLAGIAWNWTRDLQLVVPC